MPPLAYHSGLEAVAQPWSAHMASTGMAHNPSVSSQIPAGWRAWGENVAYAGGYPDLPSTIHTNWMNSPGHRANILRSTFTHVGIGYHVAPDGSAWATQVFARY
ncbi:CAP domain-containing protein [Sanguibacter sp. YZGR15]|uniref:CAP domain-containing protein n=1 Tax=Sanguibacter suaedae TaxID=2795737 RepID=A0A934I0Y5_9MICO|nr:CAP domain-containing protein [Sanguibacter suaedae]